MLQKLNHTRMGFLMVFGSAAGFATLAIFIKFAYLGGANALTVMCMRFVIAALCLWLAIKVQKLSPRISYKQGLQLFLLGAMGYGSMSMLFASALLYLSASLTAMLLYMYPVLVALLSLAIGDETFTMRKAIALLTCFSGLFLVLGVSFTANTSILGIMMGLGTAIVYSCYIIAGNRIVKAIHPLVTTAYVCTSAAGIFLLIGLVNGGLEFHVTPLAWLSMLGIALFATVIGLLGFFAGMNRIGATNASIISTLEPVITVILSTLLLGDSLCFWQISGGILIFSGILILQWPTRW